MSPKSSLSPSTTPHLSASERQDKQYPVARLLLISSIAWALLPLVINLSNSGESPLFFYFIYSICLTLGLAIHLKLKYSKYFKIEQLRELTGKIAELRKNREHNIWDRYSFYFAIIGRLGIGLYALASSERFAGVAVAAIIFESWVIWLIILRKLEGGKFTTGKYQIWILFICSFLGIILVNLSHDGIQKDILGSILSPGIGIALGGAFLAAISVDRSIEFAKLITNSDLKSQNEDMTSRNKEGSVANSVLVMVIAHALIAILFAILFFANNQIFYTGIFDFPQFTIQGTLVIAIYATLLAPMTLIFPLKANIYTKSLEVNSIQHITPVLSVIILLIGTRLFSISNLFSDAKVVIERFDLFLVGASIIVAINFIFHFEGGGAEKQEQKEFGYKALIIALWATGTLVFYRDPLLEDWLSFGVTWLWDGTTDYFALLGLSSTIYILILSFRTLGLQERLRHEESKAMSLYWKSEMASLGFEQQIIDIDKSKHDKQLENSELEIYAKIHIYSNESEAKVDSKSIDFPKISDLAEMKVQLAELVRSKQLGRNPSELMVLVGFAITTIFITLATRPGFTTWNGFIIDWFSILFSSTIIFTSYNLFEQRNKRNLSIFNREIFAKNFKKMNDSEINKLTINADKQNESVNAIDHKNSKDIAFTFIPSLICLLLLSMFAFLLYVKWHDTSSQFEWFSEVCPTVIIETSTEMQNDNNINLERTNQPIITPDSYTNSQYTCEAHILNFNDNTVP